LAIEVSIRTVPKTTDLVVPQNNIEFGKTQLSIIGKDIWVRDTPATGNVLMKLNGGDRCTVLEKGFMEMIRGDADYWYSNVDFVWLVIPPSDVLICYCFTVIKLTRDD